MGEANRIGNEFVKDAELQLQAEEARVVWIERGIESGLAGCKEVGVILHAGVIAHDKEAEGCEKRGEEERTKKAAPSQKRVPRWLELQSRY